MISVIILTKNSSIHIKRCLQALRKFPEVVIVDNGSTDDTLSISGTFANVKIYKRDFCGFGPLKNIGVDLAVNDWVLSMDSDEVLHPDLVNTILQLELDDKNVYQFYRKNYYDNLLINGCNWDNDYVIRLFNRKITRFNSNQVHESIMTNGLQIKQFKASAGFIYHFPYANTSQLMYKLEHYAELYAANNLPKKSIRLWMIPLKALAAFIKSYLFKKGFLYGYEGLTISSYNSMGVLVKYLKLYELSYRRSLAIAFIIDDQVASLNQLIYQLNCQTFLAQKAIILLSATTKHNYTALQIKLNEELIIPATVISTEVKQDKTVILRDYLIKHPELDAIVFYNDNSKFSNTAALAKSCCDLRLNKPIKYGEIFTQPSRF